MKRHEVENLLERYRAGTCSPSDRRMVEAWFNTELDSNKHQLSETDWTKTNEAIHNQLIPQPKVRRLHMYRAAAALTLFISLFAFWFLHRPAEDHGETERQLTQHEIHPGTNRATLSLSGGESIILSEAQDGIVTTGGAIVYGDGTQLVGSTDLQIVDITTPRAGQYRVTLPDGTSVFLNAATTLRYPTRFTDSQRIVELEGEAYFDVQKSDIPFIVKSQGQEIEVMGTQFNVSAYADESSTNTTLVEGRVRVQTADGLVRLDVHPGQQATLKGNLLEVQEVDVQKYIAWKEGLIILDRQTVGQALKQLERWYDVEFVAETSYPSDNTLSGEVFRDVPLSTFLRVLEEQTELKFQMKGRRVIVME